MKTELSNKELVKAAHQFAKAMGMDTPLIEIAKMIAELVSRLDCAIVRGDELQKQVNTLTDESEYIRNRFAECDIICGKLILAMRAAVIEAEHGEGMQAGMSWIFNTLHGPGDLPPEEEKNAQAYFDREVEPLNNKLDVLIDYFIARKKWLDTAQLQAADAAKDGE